MYATRFLIIEGNDCTGKSTLVSELRSALRVHGGWDTKNLVHRTGDMFFRFLNEYVNADRIIFDRSHFSELVYGKYLRDSKTFTREQLQALDLIIENYGVVIHCDLQPKEIVARMKIRNQTELLDEDDICEEQISKISNEYNKIFKGKNIITYVGRTANDLQDIINTITDIILSKTK